MDTVPTPVAPTPTDPAQIDALHADEFAGQGGSYEIRDGKRVLMERTAAATPAAAASAASESEPVPPVSRVDLA